MTGAPKLFFTFCLLSFSFIGHAHVSSFPPPDTLPKVFMLGEYDGDPFEAVKTQYEYPLINACHSDMETAYYCWLHMLTHLETYSKKTGFDLNGVKLWLYAFWNKDGSVAHLAFYLKPNSRNIKPEDMKAFLTGFADEYTSPVKSDKDFSNYASAAFPVQIEKKTNVVVKSDGQ